MHPPRPASEPVPADPAQKPTHARYWVVVFALALAILSYIDRVALSKAAPRIQPALHIDEQTWGMVVSAFGLGYALFEVPGGFLGDWLGPKKVLIRIVLWWSTFTAAMGWMWSGLSLGITQFLFAAGEAGGFPNLTKAFASWLRKDERVRVQGIMWAAARAGGAFTPLIVLWVFDLIEGLGVPKSASWRWAFGCFGCLGLIWGALFWWWFKDKPRDHPGVNAAELAMLKEVEGLGGGHANVPWGKIIRSRTVWLLWLQYFCLTFPWYFFITYLSKYLQEFRHLDETTAAYYAVFPLLFGAFGCLFAGLIASTLARWTGSVTFSRRLLSCTGFAGGAIFLLLSIQIKDPLWAVLTLAMASFSNDLNMPGAWGSCMDIGGKYAGTIAGSMNMMGNLAGFAAPAIGGIILQRTHGNYNVFMYVMAVAYVIGFFAWPFIDPVTPIDQEPQHAS
jgi:ACS family glucarate transporter-like MFS transporter